jgi:hypothetical protein
MNKEINDIEKDCENLNNIENWSDRLIKIKEIKERINIETEKLNNFIESLNSSDIKKPKKSKEFKNLSLDELLDLYNKSENIEEKIKLFNYIQYFIKEIELELFDE